MGSTEIGNAKGAGHRARHSAENRETEAPDPRGFTLIELLVVISILALLMALLMPVLARVRKQAKAVKCQAILRQWGGLWATVAAENDGRLEDRDMDRTRVGGFGRSDLWGEWGTTLVGGRHNPLIESIAYCPLAVASGGTPGAPEGGTFMAYGWWDPSFGRRGGSYGVNAWIGGMSFWYSANTAWNEGDKLRVWTSTNVKSPAAIPAMLDSTYPHGAILEEGPPPPFDSVPRRFPGPDSPVWGPSGCDPFCINRHEGAVNALFLDWSVRRVGLKELWTLKWDRQFNPANKWTKAGGVQPEDWPPWMRKFKNY
jgi:prepilin-type N-terminal cleavage/methylation domain-containing protein/prepilin-type processing-associated H-X9-DG protein